jgi:hypothetical protein
VPLSAGAKLDLAEYADDCRMAAALARLDG